MIKKINYFLQSLLIYFFFLIARILGIKISRIIFAFIFSFFGPLFKSKKIVSKNIQIFSRNIIKTEKNKIIDSMWKNYGKTFIEYIFLDFFQKNTLIETVGEQFSNKLKIT